MIVVLCLRAWPSMVSNAKGEKQKCRNILPVVLYGFEALSLTWRQNSGYQYLRIEFWGVYLRKKGWEWSVQKDSYSPYIMKAGRCAFTVLPSKPIFRFYEKIQTWIGIWTLEFQPDTLSFVLLWFNLSRKAMLCKAFSSMMLSAVNWLANQLCLYFFILMF